MHRAEEIARSYIAASNRCDYESMSDLFHQDAEWIPISPIEPGRGRGAIRERYLNLVKPMNHPIINERYIADEHRCVVEFEVDHPEHGRVPIVDIFDVDRAGRDHPLGRLPPLTHGQGFPGSGSMSASWRAGGRACRSLYRPTRRPTTRSRDNVKHRHDLEQHTRLIGRCRRPPCPAV